MLQEAILLIEVHQVGVHLLHREATLLAGVRHPLHQEVIHQAEAQVLAGAVV